jgi:hypothetical protein
MESKSVLRGPPQNGVGFENSFNTTGFTILLPNYIKNGKMPHVSNGLNYHIPYFEGFRLNSV